ncbi:MAG: acetate/propionate family kinase [Bacteroidota bacterium]
MNLLIFNCGSSSIKIEGIDTLTNSRWLDFRVERLQEDAARIQINDQPFIPCKSRGHQAVFEEILPLLKEQLGEKTLQGTGHRVVHGGTFFKGPVLIGDAEEEKIDSLNPLAPLHNPINLMGIRFARKSWPNLPHIAVFDTAFHHTLPKRSQVYALPKELTEKYAIRRYGFHGTSHQYVARQAAEYLQTDIRQLRLITCHLGNGASLAAVEYGRSIETSMGMTPLEGLVMGTRSGDVDPGILLWLMEKEGWTVEEADLVLNKYSGLKGISGESDMRDLEAKAAEGDEDARRAILVFAHRLRKYIGAYAAVMGGVDAIIFTGGIGENSQVIRERACQRLDFLGAVLSEDKNRDADQDDRKAIAEISTSFSRVRLLVIPTDESGEIAHQARALITEISKPKPEAKPIPVAISARHVHLTQEAVEVLFGKGHTLEVHRWLTQPGQFAAKEQVTLVGPKRSLERVRVLGPTRSKNQVEISRTDEFFLGIDAPVRASGHIENTPGIKLIGPAGSLELTEGVICAWRHIHMTPEDAEAFGLADKDVVEVRIENEERSLTFGQVLVRVSPNYVLEMHIDTDEGNAAELRRQDTGVLVASGNAAQFVKRRVS